MELQQICLNKCDGDKVYMKRDLVYYQLGLSSPRFCSRIVFRLYVLSRTKTTVWNGWKSKNCSSMLTCIRFLILNLFNLYIITSQCQMKQKQENNNHQEINFFFGGKKHKRQSRILSTISHIGIASLYLNYFIGIPKNESKQIPKMHVYGKLRTVFQQQFF